MTFFYYKQVIFSIFSQIFFMKTRDFSKLWIRKIWNFYHLIKTINSFFFFGLYFYQQNKTSYFKKIIKKET